MFLTTAMATSTMLYIGFSFTDDYLNDFRAEVLSMLRPRRSLKSGQDKGGFVAFRSACQDKVPIGYGIIEGKSKHDLSFFRYSPPFFSFVHFQRVVSIALSSCRQHCIPFCSHCVAKASRRRPNNDVEARLRATHLYL